MADIVPKKNYKIADETLDETEVITRMLFVLHHFHIYDLEKFDWNVKFRLFIDFRKDFKIKELIP